MRRTNLEPFIDAPHVIEMTAGERTKGLPMFEFVHAHNAHCLVVIDRFTSITIASARSRLFRIPKRW